ncbi:MAG: hypothetical protein ACLQAH_14465 [Limisphaerales bacterium]
MPGRDVILTTLRRVRFEYAAPFLYSLRQAGYQGQVVFFVTQMGNESIAELRRNGALVVPFHFSWRSVNYLVRLWGLWRRIFACHLPPAARETLAHVVFHIFYRRHLLYLQYLQEHRREYNRVFLTDCRDVFFQADPFSWNPAPGLHLFLEEAFNKIGMSDCHINWLRNQFGQAVLDEIGDKTISCAGTTFGDTNGILEYLSLMVAHAMKARNLSNADGDQGIHNYLLHKKCFSRVTVHDNRHGPVMTLGVMKPEAVQLNAQGWVINDDRDVVPVLHQYDRIPQIKKVLLDHLHGDFQRNQSVTL